MPVGCPTVLSLSLSPAFPYLSLPLFLFWSVWPGLLMHFTLYDLFAYTLFGQTGGRKEAGVGVGVWHSRRLGQLTQKACRLISLNIYEIKAQAAGVLKFDSLLWSLAACVYVCVCMGMFVCLPRMRHC